MQLFNVLALVGSLATVLAAEPVTRRDLSACITAATNQQTACLGNCASSDSVCTQDWYVFLIPGWSDALVLPLIHILISHFMFQCQPVYRRDSSLSQFTAAQCH
jgi:hypothetical protein